MDNSVGALIILAGIIIAAFGGLMFLVAAFRESIWWGLACLFLPFVSFFFLIVHWSKARRPFFLQLFGLGVIIVGAIISPQTLHH
jgi:FtsH-binding integral membrane protein